MHWQGQLSLVIKDNNFLKRSFSITSEYWVLSKFYYCLYFIISLFLSSYSNGYGFSGCYKYHLSWFLWETFEMILSPAIEEEKWDMINCLKFFFITGSSNKAAILSSHQRQLSMHLSQVSILHFFSYSIHILNPSWFIGSNKRFLSKWIYRWFPDIESRPHTNFFLEKRILHICSMKVRLD